MFEFALVIELVVNNPNEWLPFKISGILLVSLFLIMVASSTDSLEAVSDSIFTVSMSMFFISIICVILSLIYGLLFQLPTVHIDSEQVSTVNIISINDAYQVKGYGNMVAFVIGENGVYRYYYETESGLKKQDFVDAYNAFIDDKLPKGVQPYLELVRSYDIEYSKYNKKTVGKIRNEETWYVFHVPQGSIIESYNLDLM